MKKLFIVANWKSNKTQFEANSWLQQALSIKNKALSTENKEIIICPSFTLLSDLKTSITDNQLSFRLGAQDISPFDNGAYTGEICGSQIKEFADYVLIGHSERRKNFGETDGVINQKMEMAIKYNLIPILCISELSQISKLSGKAGQNYSSKLKNLIVAYEPLFAIGSGQADDPERAEKIAQKIKSELEDAFVLYGGSVTEDNIKLFTQMPNIDGVLVGASSLDASKFCKIIEFSESSSFNTK